MIPDVIPLNIYQYIFYISALKIILVFFLSVNILDNTIELTETPIPESKLHNEYYRIIGVGALGLADWLAKRKLTYRNSTKQVNATKVLHQLGSVR